LAESAAESKMNLGHEPRPASFQESLQGVTVSLPRPAKVPVEVVGHRVSRLLPKAKSIIRRFKVDENSEEAEPPCMTRPEYRELCGFVRFGGLLGLVMVGPREGVA
jgi:hypothetical protein